MVRPLTGYACWFKAFDRLMLAYGLEISQVVRLLDSLFYIFDRFSRLGLLFIRLGLLFSRFCLSLWCIGLPPPFIHCVQFLFYIIFLPKA